VLGAALVLALIALVVAVRRDRTPHLDARLVALAQDNERLERELRAAVENTSAQVRVETSARLAEVQAGLTQQMTGMAGMQGQQLLGFGQQVAKVNEAAEAAARANREEGAKQLKDFATLMQQQLADMSRSVQNNLAEVRGTLQTQLLTLQQGNETKLDQMRATVEEKLQTTLEARLGESFRLVSERLEQVHKGLGEMQTLAAGVGDLKRVLTNVKSRGSYGEVQLGMLLEQVLAPDQYAKNVKTRPGSNDLVEYAVRLPGRADDGEPCWLPIDSKFPTEDYERLLGAIEIADGPGIDAAGKAIEAAIRKQARNIRDKYIASPHTTDFAILFLPAEGLFAEVLRRPGLSESLNRECRIVVAGPTTLLAMLNSLQMGFRTLALEKRSAEVWQVLGAVKTEFGRFGGVLASLKRQLQSASNTIDDAATRTRAMDRALKSVEALPAEQTIQLLPPIVDDQPSP
ncbi:MAG TPA: DNA recombination protein RmuC, partial [Burkholderiaceae bacterium]|nr:DNA recombination protein RmuC [Burkholderiaceae bacterium]